MYFVVGLPRTQKTNDSILEVMDQLIQYTHVIPVKSSYSTKNFSRIFQDHIVCRHVIPLSIIMDRGSIHI